MLTVFLSFLAAGLFLGLILGTAVSNTWRVVVLLAIAIPVGLYIGWKIYPPLPLYLPVGIPGLLAGAGTGLATANFARRKKPDNLS